MRTNEPKLAILHTGNHQASKCLCCGEEKFQDEVQVLSYHLDIVFYAWMCPDCGMFLAYGKDSMKNNDYLKELELSQECG